MHYAIKFSQPYEVKIISCILQLIVRGKVTQLVSGRAGISTQWTPKLFSSTQLSLEAEFARVPYADCGTGEG